MKNRPTTASTARREQRFRVGLPGLIPFGPGLVGLVFSGLIFLALPLLGLSGTAEARGVDDAVDEGYQRNLPGAPSHDFELPDWLKGGEGGSGGGGEASRDGTSRRASGGGGGGSGGRAERRRSVPNESGTNFNPNFDGLGTALLWVLGAIALIALVVILMKARGGKADEDEDEEDDEEEETEETEQDELVQELMKEPLAPHEELAAAGRWEEAIHALLLMVLRELILRSPVELHDALTSRELLAELKTYVTEEMALQTLVYDVEECHFGHATADELRYHRCLQAANNVLASVKERTERTGESGNNGQREAA